MSRTLRQILEDEGPGTPVCMATESGKSFVGTLWFIDDSGHAVIEAHDSSIYRPEATRTDFKALRYTGKATGYLKVGDDMFYIV